MGGRQAESGKKKGKVGSLKPADKESETFEVQDILKKRLVNGQAEYLVWWKGFEESDASWEPKKNFEGNEEVIEEFEAKRQKEVAAEIAQMRVKQKEDYLEALQKNYENQRALLEQLQCKEAQKERGERDGSKPGVLSIDSDFEAEADLESRSGSDDSDSGEEQESDEQRASKKGKNNIGGAATTSKKETGTGGSVPPAAGTLLQWTSGIGGKVKISCALTSSGSGQA